MRVPARWAAIVAVLLSLPLTVLAQANDECLACHGDRSLAMERGGRSVSLFVDAAKFAGSTHGSQSCADCHQGLKASDLPHAKVIRPVNCQTCHEVAAYDKSIHGRERPAATPGGKSTVAAACKDCHGYHDVLPPGDPGSPTNHFHLSQTCGKCHERVDQRFRRSAHGTALEAGVKGAPSCVSCHGEHNVELITSKESPVSKIHEARACLKCHLDDPDVRAVVAQSAGFIGSYETSVHGVSLAAGNQKAATCSDCHGAHDMKKPGDPTALVNKWNIAQTCGRCHSDIARVFDESIHGQSLREGNREAPTCTDCHGEHQIFAPGDPRARVSPTNVSSQVCAACHESVQLSAKYGLPEERFKTFTDSFHGLASRGGVTEVANCASCHGVHNIRPSSDPTSTISGANLAKTCGQCHPGAGENFTKGSVHVTESRDGSAVLFWIRTFYLWIIATTIGGMAAHNAIDFVKKATSQIAMRAGRIPREHHGSDAFIRMTISERIQHAVMFTSFITLVITGFMLKFPDAWWVAPIRQLSEKVFEIRSLLHRTAGVVMIGVSLYHVYYLIFTKRGKRLFVDMLPRLQDVKDAAAMQLYNTGFSARKPLFGRFGYVEKAEYWALIWGAVVMAGTGIVMWFDNFFINLFTKLGWDVARTIHYYEAILATLAIVVWHFYFVIFNPSVYPMSTAWWNGRISEEEMADEHPLELEQIRAEQLRPQNGGGQKPVDSVQ